MSDGDGDASRAEFETVMAALVRRLRAIPAATLPGLHPCASCGFTTTTDLGAGEALTALGMLAAFGSADGEQFWCHAGQPRVPGYGWLLGERRRICAGFAARDAAVSRETLRAALEASFREAWPDFPALSDADLTEWVAKAHDILRRHYDATQAAHITQETADA